MIAVGPPPIDVIDATTQRSFRAADVKAQYRLLYVDGFAAALAMKFKATLVTGDSDFRRLGRSISVLWLKS